MNGYKIIRQSLDGYFFCRGHVFNDGIAKSNFIDNRLYFYENLSDCLSCEKLDGNKIICEIEAENYQKHSSVTYIADTIKIIKIVSFEEISNTKIGYIELLINEKIEYNNCLDEFEFLNVVKFNPSIRQYLDVSIITNRTAYLYITRFPELTDKLKHLLIDDYSSIKLSEKDINLYDYYKPFVDNMAYQWSKTFKKDADYMLNKIKTSKDAYNWISKVNKKDVYKLKDVIVEEEYVYELVKDFPTLLSEKIHLIKSAKYSCKISLLYPQVKNDLIQNVNDIKYAYKWVCRFPEDKEFLLNNVNQFNDKYIMEWVKKYPSDIGILFEFINEIDAIELVILCPQYKNILKQYVKSVPCAMSWVEMYPNDVDCFKDLLCKDYLYILKNHPDLLVCCDINQMNSDEAYSFALNDPFNRHSVIHLIDVDYIELWMDKWPEDYSFFTPLIVKSEYLIDLAIEKDSNRLGSLIPYITSQANSLHYAMKYDAFKDDLIKNIESYLYVDKWLYIWPDDKQYFINKGLI